MNAIFKNFEIRVFLIKNKGNTEELKTRKNYRVSVKNIEINRETSFDYLADDINYEVATEYDVLNVFYDILTEVLDGRKSYNEFCRKYQFSYYNKFAMDGWQNCKNFYKKFRNIYNKNIDILQKQLNDTIDANYIPDEN